MTMLFRMKNLSHNDSVKSSFTNLKDKLRQALSSTARVISDDFKIKDSLDKNKDHHESNFFDIEKCKNPILFCSKM